MMNIRFKMIKAGLAALMLTALTACGGGGGGGSSSGGDGNPDPDPEPVTSKTFSLSLTGIKVLRLTTGEQVEIDTPLLESGDLEYKP